MSIYYFREQKEAMEYEMAMAYMGANEASERMAARMLSPSMVMPSEGLKKFCLTRFEPGIIVLKLPQLKSNAKSS